MPSNEQKLSGRGSLEGKVVLITGGTTGIGRASAERFVAQGARVIVTGQDEARLERTRAELGPNVMVARWDSKRVEDGAAFARSIQDRYGGLDVAFMNAGVARLGPLSMLDETAFDEEMDTNVKGVVMGLRALSPVLNDGASIILNASISAGRGTPNFSVYSATKGALVSFAKSLAVELAPRRIRVNAISPGLIHTAIQAKFGLPEAVAKASYEMFRAKIPLGRFGEADEVASLVLFLAGNDASFITGAEIPVDGGLSASA